MPRSSSSGRRKSPCGPSMDTAAPFLMGASIVRTNLPGVMISQAGLYIAYDVAYALASRYTVKAQVSYGARDGASHVGGGVGMAVDF